MDLLGGLQKRMPPVGICFAAGAVAITCLPPLNGFSSELLLVLGLAKGGTTLPALECRLGLPAALAGLALISGLAVAAFAKAYGTCFLGEARTGAAAQAQTPDAVPLACLLLPAAVCLAVGLLPQYVLEYIAPAGRNDFHEPPCSPDGKRYPCHCGGSGTAGRRPDTFSGPAAYLPPQSGPFHAHLGLRLSGALSAYPVHRCFFCGTYGQNL